ncbi:hypothetical protein ACFWAT_21130 [Streptomyces syringium]|uniref:hypothetical protein n=1 Tax=Streptomyces syringium TaxID=76729 RepID=UPI00365419E1
MVTADLQSVNGDRHLRPKHHADPVTPKQGAATRASMRREFDTSLGGAPRVELLGGGVAVLELAPMLFPLEWAAEPLGAALTLASRAQALILDLRANRGGAPDTVAFVCGYLLDERTHLNTMYWRGGERGDPCDGWTVHPHLEVTVPVGRAVNPVSGTNWEGTGVQPDIPCAAADSLDHAHTLALARLAG